MQRLRETSQAHDIGIATLAETRYPPGHRIGAHAHDHSKVSLILAGSVTESCRDDTFVGLPLHAVVKPATTPHSDTVGPDGAHVFTIRFDPGRLASSTTHTAALYDWRLGGELVQEILELWVDFRAGNRPTDGRVHRLLDAVQRRPSPPSPPPGWLRTVTERLHDAAGNRPSLPELADLAGVDRAHLARVFRRTRGCTITEFCHRLRIRRAITLIGSGRPLVDVALHVGFADQAHFTRAFRKATGLTPSQYRSLQRACSEPDWPR